MDLFQPTIGRICLSIFLTTILVPFINTTTVACHINQCGPGVTLFVTPVQTMYLYQAKAGFGLFYTPTTHINYAIFTVGFVFYYLISCAVLYAVTHHRLHRRKKNN